MIARVSIGCASDVFGGVFLGAIALNANNRISNNDSDESSHNNIWLRYNICRYRDLLHCHCLQHEAEPKVKILSAEAETPGYDLESIIAY